MDQFVNGRVVAGFRQTILVSQKLDYKIPGDPRKPSAKRPFFRIGIKQSDRFRDSRHCFLNNIVSVGWLQAARDSNSKYQRPINLRKLFPRFRILGRTQPQDQAGSSFRRRCQEIDPQIPGRLLNYNLHGCRLRIFQEFRKVFGIEKLGGTRSFVWHLACHCPCHHDGQERSAHPPVFR